MLCFLPKLRSSSCLSNPEIDDGGEDEFAEDEEDEEESAGRF